MWKGRWIALLSVFFCLFILVSSCRPNAVGPNVEFPGETYTVSRGNLMISVSGNGTIAANKETDISFDKGGKVDKIYVVEGDSVIAAQALALLVPLNKGQLELAVTQAEAALAQAEYTLDNAENPFTDEEIKKAEQAIEDAEDRLDLADDMLRYVLQHGGEWEVLQWKMEVLNAEIQLEMAEDKLDDMLNERDEDQIYVLRKQAIAAAKSLEEALAELKTETLVAPFAGIVSSVYIDEGKILPSPSISQISVIQLIDPTSMEFIISLDEIDVPGIMIGDRAIVNVDAFPETVFEGRVISITSLPVVAAGLVYYDVTIAFSAPLNTGIRVGMSATADIVKNELQNVLLVPNRAIYTNNDGKLITKVLISNAIDGVKIEERVIDVGISDGIHTEVLSGLEEGQLVVLEASGS